MERAMNEMVKISQDEMERYLYLREEMAESDRVSQLESAKDIGREEGRREGRGEGEILKLISQVKKKKLKGDSITKIADDLVEEITKIQPIFNAITENPKATKEEIYDRIKKY